MEQLSTLTAFKRHTRPIVAGVVLGLTLIWAQNALASPLQPADNTAKTMAKEAQTCTRAIASQERRQGIPAGLLQAISHAESGRWNAQQGAVFAWPWTVTTGGKGHFLPNRADAVAFVQSLQADGVENIDVGCMQISLKYHPDAFASIHEAFDPRANAAYAAGFLRERFGVSNSWLQAAGDYHSTTEALNQKYRQKVSALWEKTRTPAATPIQVAAVRVSRPDGNLTKRFNLAFSSRRADAGISSMGVPGSGQVIANRINALKPGAHMGRPSGQNAADSFAKKRQAQLMAWRQDNGLSPVTAALSPAPKQ